MKILHIVEDFSVKSGGLRTVIKNLDFYLKKAGYNSFILASDKENDDTIFVVKASNKWLFSSEWEKKILSIVDAQNIDLIHIHGAWLYPQFIGAKIASQKKIPMVLSLHGMFQPWLWKKGTLKKKLYFNFLSKKYFAKAKIIHSITQEETTTIKSFFYNNVIVEIPNLISVDTINEEVKISNKNIVYLGRLNKTKGIDLLINAFAKIQNKEIKLIIAGRINAYKIELESLVKKLNIEDKVTFIGEVKDVQKRKLIQFAWVMASPTYSDVIGMVNLEAASLKTPMITTYKTGLHRDWNINGGRLIQPNVTELKSALEETLNWSLEKRNAQGELLFNFVKKEYSWENRIKDWELLYKKAINNEK